MVRRITTKLRQMGDANRHYLYLPSSLALDPAFPLKLGGEVEVEIRGDLLIVRKAKKEGGA